MLDFRPTRNLSVVLLFPLIRVTRWQTLTQSSCLLLETLRPRLSPYRHPSNCLRLRALPLRRTLRVIRPSRLTATLSGPLLWWTTLNAIVGPTPENVCRTRLLSVPILTTPLGATLAPPHVSTCIVWWPALSALSRRLRKTLLIPENVPATELFTLSCGVATSALQSLPVRVNVCRTRVLVLRTLRMELLVLIRLTIHVGRRPSLVNILTALVTRLIPPLSGLILVLVSRLPQHLSLRDPKLLIRLVSGARLTLMFVPLTVMDVLSATIRCVLLTRSCVATTEVLDGCPFVVTVPVTELMTRP